MTASSIVAQASSLQPDWTFSMHNRGSLWTAPAKRSSKTALPTFPKGGGIAVPHALAKRSRTCALQIDLQSDSASFQIEVKQPLGARTSRPQTWPKADCNDIWPLTAET